VVFINVADGVTTNHLSEVKGWLRQGVL
jgi:hypothetical protein